MVKRLRIKKMYGGGIINTFSTDIAAAPFMGGGQGVGVYNPSNVSIPTVTPFAKAGDISSMGIKNAAGASRFGSDMGNMTDNLANSAMDGFYESKGQGGFGKELDNTGGGDEEKPGLFKSMGAGLANVGKSVVGFMGKHAGAINMGLNMLGTKDKTINSTDEMMEGLRSGIQDKLISSGNPALAAAGIGVKLVSKLGGNTDASQGLGGFNDAANAAASFIPGAGFFVGRTEKYKKSQELSNSAGYTGTSAAGDKAMKNAGAKLLFGRGKANRMIREQRRRDQMVQGILKEAKDDFAGAESAGYIANRNQMDSMGGYKALSVKKGGVIKNMEFVNRCKKKRKKMQEGGSVSPAAMPVDFVERMEVANGTKGSIDDVTKKSNVKNNKKQNMEKLTEQVQKQSQTGMFYLKRGGKVNVIPSGKLHKERHRLEKLVEGMDRVSKKGIPIVTTNSVGELRQQAEIERDEIILNKELSEKLLSLMESEDEDKAMIEAGMLLADEIIDNTEDNTNLIKSVKV